MEAIYPDVRADSARPGPARTETISCVSNYQFGWHITYPYADDVAPLLPAGTIVHITSWHDNTPANKYNPNPRNWVGGGPRSIDEMSFAWVTHHLSGRGDYQQRVAERGSRRATHRTAVSVSQTVANMLRAQISSASRHSYPGDSMGDGSAGSPCC